MSDFKILNIIVFNSAAECEKHSNQVCEHLANLPTGKFFCGIWGEIEFNKNDVLTSISKTVNHFISSDAKEIFFGCCKKDYTDIIAAIDTQNYKVSILSYKDLIA